jgi:hypothetical protein
MTHYAWAPEDLEHLSNPKRKRSPNQTVARLRKVEVPFNHILALFFSLAPSSVMIELFRKYASVEDCGDVRLLGRHEVERDLCADVTQPDLVFDGELAFLTIEVKTSSNTRIEQLQKYAYLHSLAAKAKPGRIHALLFLSPYQQDKLFKEKLVGWNEIKMKAAEGLLNGDYKKRLLTKVANSKAIEFLSTPAKLKIGHCTFEQFAALVRDLCNRASPENVEYRLYRGMLAELKTRVV